MAGKQSHVDHIDGDDSNNPPDGSNWQTLCQQGHSRKTWAEQHGKQWDGRCSVPTGFNEDGTPKAGW